MRSKGRSRLGDESHSQIESGSPRPTTDGCRPTAGTPEWQLSGSGKDLHRRGSIKLSLNLRRTIHVAAIDSGEVGDRCGAIDLIAPRYPAM